MVNKRTQDRIDSNLGIIRPGGHKSKSRSPRLEKIASYLSSSQHDQKMDWDEADSCSDRYVPIKERKPKVIYPLTTIITDRLAPKLLGKSMFPNFLIEEDPDTQELIRLLIKQTQYRSKMLSMSKPWLAYGSAFMRFKLVAGLPVVETYESRFCYPKFDNAGELKEVKVQYVFEDEEDLDERGKPTQKWYRLDLTPTKDVLYDNPPYQQDVEPLFKVVAENNHDLGFVQGEWFKTSDTKHSPDGDSLVEPILDFEDALSYNLSQSDRATSYGMDPQAVFKGMDEEELENLIKSSDKGWNVGREGEASFLEVSGSGLDQAEKTENRFDTKVQDITRVLMLDPEKIVGSAQSAKAMEVMHGPMLDLIDELRPHLEKGMIRFLTKLTLALVIYNKRGAELLLQMPPQYIPTSLDIDAAWGEVFPKTLEDLQKKVNTILQATNNNVLSRQTGLERLQKEFEVEDIEEEVRRINTQPQFNTFGF